MHNSSETSAQLCNSNDPSLQPLQSDPSDTATVNSEKGLPDTPVLSETYPRPLPLALLITAISLACFVVALDRTIVATAIPRITDQFHSPNDVGWYASAYLLTSCAFQPTYGHIYAHFDVRWSFLTALGLFEVGSLVCGVAQSSVTLIVGRAIAGLGCAGVFAGAMVIISVSVELRRRPMFVGMVGSIFGIGTVCGPLMGGAFTNDASWRWCFYLNLPVGAVTFIILLLFFHPPRTRQTYSSLVERMTALDPLGNFLIITTVIMLLLALQWGGTVYSWKSPRIVGLLIGTGLEASVFFAWQWHLGPHALLPLNILFQRTVAASFGMSFFLAGATFVNMYYLPYWFQASRGISALESGVDVVPYVTGTFVFSMIAGIITTKTGYFNPQCLIGPILTAVGCGLLSTLHQNTPTDRWVGYEILTSGGIGFAAQQGIVAAQAVVSPEFVSIASAMILFAQSLSGAIFVSVGNNVLRNELSGRLTQAHFPSFDVSAILAAGATEVRSVVSPSQLPIVLNIYNDALDKVFIIGVPLSILGLICAAFMEWKTLRIIESKGTEKV